MNNNKLLELTKKGETENIEFKEKISGLNNEMVAFANSGGRKIFIGINDKNKNYCKNVNVPQYKLDVNDKYFRIEFYRSMDYLKLAGLNAPLNVPQNVPVNKGQKELLGLISSAKFTINELSVKLNVADKTIKRDLKKLIDFELVERIGSDKSGYYRIKLKEEKK